MSMVTPEHLVPGDEVSRVVGATRLQEDAPELVVGDGAVTVDAAGWIALPPLADLHAHLDKAYTWEAAGRPKGSLEDAVACWREFGASLTQEQIVVGARRQLRAALSAGVLSIRSHVNFHEGDDPLRGVRALVALREEFRGLVDLQLVAMPGFDRDDALVREAVALGVDLLGGAPHLAPDPRADLHRILRLAEEAGVGVDVHADETLDVHAGDLRELARVTAQWPADRIRSAGHCVSLAMLEPRELGRVLDEVAAAGVSIVTNPLTNLYLQGWAHPVATPRALPPLTAILEAGVLLAAGGDNVQDPFNPLGNADMVDVVSALVLAGHLDPARAWAVAATGGRRVFRPEPADGAPDVLLVRAGSV
ncbi:MAG: amidohydrolase family protein, partial [Microbacterium sp.]|uniref:amidohydrolase family protein n=1 Tax=Microbacterium sp. TaxID=51671 RepID=UPI0039E3F1EB